MGRAALDLAAAARSVLDAWRAEPDLMQGIELPSPARAGLLAGEAGILTVAWQLAPDDALADTLFERVTENVQNDANEIMWGSPGTMLAARRHARVDRRHALGWRPGMRAPTSSCGDARTTASGRPTSTAASGVASGPLTAWSATCSHCAGGCRASRESSWNGSRRPRWRPGPLSRTDCANWANHAEVADLQWCSGAPGIVISAADYLDEELLLAGAELVWQAGPHGDEKGYGICHGTAGNGYALLKTFERTGDERWLERARRFAVHAFEQAARLEGTRGRRRYSLWTGDVGAALYAADCLDARARYPILDTWD